MKTVHIVGAGMAGLACAVRLAGTGRRVVLHEAARQAGGRCRSFRDSALGCVIDNGNHLLLSGNTAVARFLADTGATDELTGPEDAAFPFVDLEDDCRWTLRIDRGRIPWWIFRQGRRIPGTRLLDYASAIRLAAAGQDARLGDVLATDSIMFRRFWDPLAVAVLNTPAAAGSASLLWQVMRETFGRGADHCRPRIARRGLSEAFVEPASVYLVREGAELRPNRRLRQIDTDAGVVKVLRFAQDDLQISPDETVVLAVSAPVAGDLLEGLQVPRKSHAIVNAHFRVDRPLGSEHPRFLGIIGGVAHWLFLRGDIVSVTVSAADSLAEQSSDCIARLLWRDVSRALTSRESPMPDRYRIIKEKRATFSQTPESIRLRPPARTRFGNLLLAGDWTRTGLPATIEGAIRSGNTAADAIIRS